MLCLAHKISDTPTGSDGSTRTSGTKIVRPAFSSHLLWGGHSIASVCRLTVSPTACRLTTNGKNHTTTRIARAAPRPNGADSAVASWL